MNRARGACRGKRFWRGWRQILWPHRWAAAVMCGLMLVGVAVELVPPKLQQYLVDHILKDGRITPDCAGAVRPRCWSWCWRWRWRACWWAS